MRLLIAFLVVLLSGCANMPGMPGHITGGTSKFDNENYLSMTPAFVYVDNSTFSPGPFQLGLFWSSKYRDSIVISAKIQDISTIKSTEGLQFKIDGELFKLTSPSVSTDFDVNATRNLVTASSIKKFPTNVAFIEKLLSAKSVKVKLVTSKGYVDGDFKADKTSAAIRGFRDFLSRVKKS